MASGDEEQDRRRAERLKAVMELLRDVPSSTELDDLKSRWIVADRTKPDPRSVY